MREISVSRIEEAVCRMVQQINYAYPPQIETDMKRMAEEETHPIARSTLQFLLDNARIAKEEHIPICQDTGMAVIFMKHRPGCPLHRRQPAGSSRSRRGQRI